MKKIIVCLITIMHCMVHAQGNNYIFLTKGENAPASTSWTIIGAGPAGITTIGLLLDLGVQGKDITWVDPDFGVGRIGQLYSSIPSNTKTKLFVEFINACKVFQECDSPALEKLYQYNPEIEYPLHIIIDPLKDITTHLMSKVNVLRTRLQSLNFQENVWGVGVTDSQFTSEHVVLATGSHPYSLDYSCNHEIPLDMALNKERLAQEVTSEDSIAVVGGAHSAVLILKFLSELNVKRIINFYKSPIRYAVDMGDWILYNESGLGGIAAQWAQNVLEKSPPANLVRIYNCAESLDAWLPICNKIIYAVGFERNTLPVIPENAKLEYDSTTGIIAPRLFGIGIAFPETYTDPLGNVEYRIGLSQFMEYAQRVIPQWMKKDYQGTFERFNQLFTIDLL